MQSVEKWSMTIHRLFSKDPNDEEENVTQNIYVFRFILFCIIVYSFEMLLNSVDIFIVDKTIFTRGYVTGCLFAAVYVLILLHLGLEHPLTKYVSITAVSLIIMAASVSLTYHMIIIIMMPIIIAGMYTSKQLSIYTFVLTVLSIIISTYAGYYYGVCDANMVLLTTTSMNHLVENGIFLLNQVNENPGVTLALYYVLPRCLMAMSFVYVSNIVNQVIRKSLKNAMKMAFRYGGDEMLALIPGGTGETAEKMIKTWKQTLAAVQVDCEIPISAAVGYAIGEHEKLKNVIAEADRNMYACKHAGRNSTEK